MNNQIAQSPKEPSTALVNLISVSSWKVTSNLCRPEWLCPSRLLPPTPSQHPHLLLRGEKLIPSAMETCRKSEWKAGQCSWIIKQKGEFDKILGRGSSGHGFCELNQSPSFKLLSCHILTYQLPQEARWSSLPFSLLPLKKKFSFLFSLMC